MRDDSIQTLSEALKVNQTLTMLKLVNNQIGAAGMRALSEALKINTSLLTLDLSENYIDNDAAHALAEMLKVNQTLNTLILADTHIKANMVLALCEALKTNRTLTILNLDDNKIGIDGMQALLEIITINVSLKNLELSSDAYDDEDDLSYIGPIIGAINNILQTRATRNQTLLTLVILLRHASSLNSVLPMETWELILSYLDFPSVTKGYRTSEAIVNFLNQKPNFTEFNQRLQSKTSFRLVETHGTKLSELSFAFLAPKPAVNSESSSPAILPEIQRQPDGQALLKRIRYQ